MADKKEFHKYAGRGAYHWEALSRSVKHHNPYLAGRYRLVLKLLGRPRPGACRLLDIGCGDGALSFLLSRAGWGVIGLDYSETGLKLAKTKFGRDCRAAFMRGDSLILPVKDKTLDAVVAADIIEHLSAPEVLLTELARVLKAGGIAVITTPVKRTEVPIDPEHVREFSEGEFMELLKRYFGSVELIKSHPAPLVERYARQHRVLGLFGRLRPYRYLYNFMSSYLGRNPFLNGDPDGRYTQMSALARKA